MSYAYHDHDHESPFYLTPEFNTPPTCCPFCGQPATHSLAPNYSPRYPGPKVCHECVWAFYDVLCEMMDWDEDCEPLGEAETRSLGAAGQLIGATEEEGPGPMPDILCSFCERGATAWLIPVDLDFGPDDDLPSLCDRCVNVLRWVMEQLPGSTPEWGFVDLEWLLRSTTDEEDAVSAAEDVLGYGPSPEEWR